MRGRGGEGVTGLPMPPADVEQIYGSRGGAWFPANPGDGRFRYLLWRHGIAPAGRGYLLVIGFNPSTATESEDDPTIARCWKRAQGFAGLLVANLFAFRSTDPAALKTAADPVGPANDEAIRRAAGAADLILCACGAHPAAVDRGRLVLSLLEGRELHVLGLTAGGHPRHPLYMPYSAQPVRWRP